MHNDIYNNKTYSKNNPNWHSEDSAWKANHLFSLVDSPEILQQLSSPIKIVEVGCGAGGVLRAVCDRFIELTYKVEGVGCDLSEEIILKARANHSNLSFRIGDFKEIDDSCDVLILADFLEHIKEPEGFLRNLKDKTKFILFHFPLDDNFYGKLRRGKGYYKYLKEDRGHIHFFNRQKIIGLLNKTDITIDSWKYTFWGIELDKTAGRFVPILKLFRKIGYAVNQDLSVKAFGGASMAVLGSFR